MQIKFQNQENNFKKEKKVFDLDLMRTKLECHNLRSLSAAIGVKYGSLWRFVRRGKEPRYSTVIAIAKYLGMGDTNNG